MLPRWWLSWLTRYASDVISPRLNPRFFVSPAAARRKNCSIASPDCRKAAISSSRGTTSSPAYFGSPWASGLCQFSSL